MLPMALLLASKTIYEEASLVLFSDNTFVLPTLHYTAMFFAAFNGKGQLSRITKLELAFTTADLHSDQGHLPIHQAGKIARAAHPDELLNHIIDIWSRKALLALSSTRCKQITIRMEDAQCLQKSCRLDDNARWRLVLPRDPWSRVDDYQPAPRREVSIRGLPDRSSLQRVLSNIGGYREEDSTAN